MARRKRAAGDPAGVMPTELRRMPSTAEEFDYWLAGDTMPPDWDFGGPLWWRRLESECRWSRARHAWREEHDPTYWWYRHRTRQTDQR